MNRTLQDRLIKEMRLAGIDNMEAGNAFLPGFMNDYNRRFAVVPARSDDLHRPMNLAPDRLAYIKERQETRDKPTVKTNSDKNGYVKRARGPGRQKDVMNDPAVIARREKALLRQQAAE